MNGLTKTPFNLTLKIKKIIIFKNFTTAPVFYALQKGNSEECVAIIFLLITI